MTRRALSSTALLAVLLVGGSACTQLHDAARKKEATGAAPSGATAPTGVAAAPPATERATAPSAAAAGARPAPAPPVKGVRHLVLALSEPTLLGGFELWMSFDAERFAVGEPVEGPAIKGYMCAANTSFPGEFRYSCASLPTVPAGGEVAVIPISFYSSAPVLEDLTVARNFLVDTMGSEMPGARLHLSLRE